MTEIHYTLNLNSLRMWLTSKLELKEDICHTFLNFFTLSFQMTEHNVFKGRNGAESRWRQWQTSGPSMQIQG